MSIFNKKIALLGGVGPWASVYAHSALTRQSQQDYGAMQDNDYPEILHVSAPLEGFGAKGIEEDSAIFQQLSGTFDLFKTWGARLAVICCNSLHRYAERLSELYPDIKIVNLPESGAEELKERDLDKVAICCAESALEDGLHSRALEAVGIRSVMPDRAQQDRINTMIETVMGGDTTQAVLGDYRRLTREFREAGAKAILSGCTELSYLSTKTQSALPVVDCLDAALTRTLKQAATP